MWFNKDISYWIEIHTDWMEIYFDVRCHVIFYFCNHCRGKDIKIFFFNFNYLRQLRRFFDISVLQQNWWHIHITNDINSFVALANVKEILSLKSAAILGLIKTKLVKKYQKLCSKHLISNLCKFTHIFLWFHFWIFGFQGKNLSKHYNKESQKI